MLRRDQDGDIGGPGLPSGLGCIQCIATHRAFPSVRNLETSWVTHPYQVNEENTHIKLEGLKQASDINPIPGTAPYNREGTPNLELLSEERRVWTTYLALHLLKQLLRKRAIKWLPLKATGACVHEIYKMIGNKETVLNGCVHTSYGYPLRVQPWKSRQICPSPCRSESGLTIW